MSKKDFSKIIKNFTDKEKREFFSFMSDEMKKQIIGYIINPFNQSEPALNEYTSYMPLKSFGTSEIHYDSKIRFIPFPDNKTLYDMVDDPINYHKWCKENLNI